ncbi:MAG: LytTR family transcriptional regulator DNA-binding domain-containing protein, partial [Ruminococcus sp.]|nr:LytTR family transcriptional regulator DNA-binding domain-containing protein [Ruminococcus sp.]
SLSHEITKKYPNIKIIFVTGYSEKYIEDIFISNHKINPYGFLKKPIDIIKLSTYINQLKDVAIPQKKDSLAFKVVKDGVSYVPLNDILYISSNKRLVTIHTLKNEYTGYNKLSSIMKDLQECSNNFYQCHKSFIVNILAISSIHQSSIIIHGNTIPLSDLHGKSVAKKREDIMRLKDILRNKGE